MSRFWIDDGNRPGSRLPRTEFRTKTTARSEVMNEAQAIAKRRKLTATPLASIYKTGRYIRLAFLEYCDTPCLRLNPIGLHVYDPGYTDRSAGKMADLYGPNLYFGWQRTQLCSGVSNYTESFYFPTNDSADRYIIVDLGAAFEIKRVDLAGAVVTSAPATGVINRFINVDISVDGASYETITSRYPFVGHDPQTIYSR